MPCSRQGRTKEQASSQPWSNLVPASIRTRDGHYKFHLWQGFVSLGASLLQINANSCREREYRTFLHYGLVPVQLCSSEVLSPGSSSHYFHMFGTFKNYWTFNIL